MPRSSDSGAIARAGAVLLVGAALQAFALSLAVGDAAGTVGLMRYVAAQALASAFLSLGTWATLPREMREPRRAVLGFGFLCNLVVPGLPLLLRAAHALGARFRRLFEDAPVDFVAEPEYSIYRSTTGLQARGGLVRSKLLNQDVPTPARLAALLAIQEVPARASADLLRQLLADPVEDIRLLAYGMLDGKEKRIGARILAEEKMLEMAIPDDARYGCHKRLAELYWELAWQRLVQGDMLRHACRQARAHVEQALALDASDAGLHFLLLRVAVQLREVEAAQAALVTARSRGFAEDQLLPYEAEIAWLERRLADVPRVLGRLPGGTPPLRLAAIVQFWVGAR
ncbi:MAG: hypothetical protein AB7P21_20400 [Lautropia sp.]